MPTGEADSVRRAVAESFELVLGLVGFGGSSAPEEGPPIRRGPVVLVVQTALVVALAAVLLALRAWFGAVTVEPSVVVVALVTAVSLLPLALHWFAEPPRRTVGLLIGLAVDAAGLAGALVLVGLPDGVLATALTVGVPLLLGAAAYGAVSTAEPPDHAEPDPRTA